MVEWIQNNYEWFFSGLGVFILATIFTVSQYLIKKRYFNRKQTIILGICAILLLLVVPQIIFFSNYWKTNIELNRFAIFLLVFLPIAIAVIISYLIFISKITDLRKELVDVKASDNFIDKLTGVLNNNALDHTVLETVNKAKFDRQPLSMLLLDVDQLKIINDDLHRDDGDAVIKVVGKHLREDIRGVNDRVIRYKMGDEFLILAYRTSGNNAFKALGERLRSDVEKFRIPSVTKKDKIINITVSIGVIEYQFGKDDIKSALDRVELALKEAKSKRNCIIFKE